MRPDERQNQLHKFAIEYALQLMSDAEFLRQIESIVYRKYMIEPDWRGVVDEVRQVITEWLMEKH